MRRNVSPARWLFTLLLLAGLFFGAAGQSLARVEAAPRAVVAPGEIVISEFRTHGPAGGSDEFVELYNKTASPIDIGNWKVKKSSACAGAIALIATIPAGITLEPGQYYLIAGSAYSSDSVIPDFIPTALNIADDGGIALFSSDGVTKIDQVGMCATTTFLDGTALTPLITNVDRGYERKDGGSLNSCIDTGDNSSDFTLKNPSDPQNQSYLPLTLCGNVPPTATATSSPTNTLSPTDTLTPTFPPTASSPLSLVINEVAWAGTSSSFASDEWIELYNPGATSIDINGWTLKAEDGTPNIVLNGSIPAGGFFLLERDDDSTISDIIADQIYTGTLSNSGEILQLFDGTNTPIDTANGNGGEWPAGSSSTYGTMERIGTLPDSDSAWTTNDGKVKNGEDSSGDPIWGTPKNGNSPTPTPLPTNTSTGTPTLTFTPTLTPTRTSLKTVVITEVAWMGTAASSSDEWIELYNTTNARVNLDGWRLRSYRYNGTDFVLNLDIDLTDHYIDPRTSIEPKNTSGYFLLEAGNDNTVSDITSDNSPGEGMIYQGSLYNSGEILLLCSTLSYCNINTKNQTVDYVNGSLTTTGTIKPWPAGSSSTYGSMERKNLISDEETNYFTHTGANPKWGLDASSNAIKGTPKHDNWAYNVTATPRPTSTRTPTRTPLPNLQPVPLLVLNEILARAGTDWNNDGTVDIYDEFIEVINSGTVDVNLSGYKLDDYELDANGKLIWNGFTLPSQTLKPGEKAVFYGSETGILLNDSGDTVYLMRASNNSVVDSYKYPVVKSVDVSICRYVDGYGSWLERCFPMPGQPNSLTGEQTPSTSGGPPAFVCLLPDSIPEEFILAECEESGLGIWNRSYWDSLPGEGDEIWIPEESGKWPVIYQ